MDSNLDEQLKYKQMKSKLLSLNKQTITNLNKEEMFKVKGGKTWSICITSRSPYLCISKKCHSEKL